MARPGKSTADATHVLNDPEAVADRDSLSELNDTLKTLATPGNPKIVSTLSSTYLIVDLGHVEEARYGAIQQTALIESYEVASSFNDEPVEVHTSWYNAHGKDSHQRNPSVIRIPGGQGTSWAKYNVPDGMLQALDSSVPSFTAPHDALSKVMSMIHDFGDANVLINSPAKFGVSLMLEVLMLEVAMESTVEVTKIREDTIKRMRKNDCPPEEIEAFVKSREYEDPRSVAGLTRPTVVYVAQSITQALKVFDDITRIQKRMDPVDKVKVYVYHEGQQAGYIDFDEHGMLPPVDIVIGTPSRIAKMLEWSKWSAMSMSNVRLNLL